jgi:hypothetical protein
VRATTASASAVKNLAPSMGALFGPRAPRLRHIYFNTANTRGRNVLRLLLHP